VRAWRDDDTAYAFGVFGVQALVVFVALALGAVLMDAQHRRPAGRAADGRALVSHDFDATAGRVAASLAEDGNRLRLDVVVTPRGGGRPLRTAARLADGQRFSMRLSGIPGLGGLDVFDAVRRGRRVVLAVTGIDGVETAVLGAAP
jgi:hypothetical protein